MFAINVFDPYSMEVNFFTGHSVKINCRYGSTSSICPKKLLERLLCMPVSCSYLMLKVRLDQRRFVSYFHQGRSFTSLIELPIIVEKHHTESLLDVRIPTQQKTTCRKKRVKIWHESLPLAKSIWHEYNN